MSTGMNLTSDKQGNRNIIIFIIIIIMISDRSPVSREIYTEGTLHYTYEWVVPGFNEDYVWCCSRFCKGISRPTISGLRRRGWLIPHCA